MTKHNLQLREKKRNYKRLWRLKNKEKEAARRKAYNEKNKEKIKARTKAWREKKQLEKHINILKENSVSI